jgi:hypothetical protein
MISAAKNRALALNIPFNITEKDIIVPEFCPILGIPLFKGSGIGGHTHNSPSLDKIIPELGYVKDNIQIISNKANLMKQDASLSDLIVLGEWAKLQLLEDEQNAK